MQTEKQNQGRDRGGNKRSFGSAGSAGHFQKIPRLDGPSRVARPGVDSQPQRCTRWGKFHLGECWTSSRGCFRCGSTDHRVRDCPQERGGVWPGGGQQPQRGSGPARGGNGFSRGRGAPGRGAGNTEARQPGGNATDVITGTFLIFGLPFIALIDIGSTHSYVASEVSGTLNMNSEFTSRKMTVLSPLGHTIVVNKLFRSVPLEVQGLIFPADLMELPFGEFDLILGMDWLVRYRANLDYTAKRMVLRTLEDEEVLVIGERRNYLSNIVSAL
ncbi:DNA/RNA polymerases superfamily protein [Gossypium australe]|uniref:DNA/RNA polymerases superfamily protein n=1 Tax=Gossypium australe TaxID=47621 RepID=A0A5B6VUK7_9ROSI|nr:DNA/RNA polymerases superfamily protein [Gossypium australe]